MLNKKTQKILSTLLGITMAGSFIPATLVQAEEIVKEQSIDGKKDQNELDKNQKILNKEVKSFKISNNNIKTANTVMNDGNNNETQSVERENLRIKENTLSTGKKVKLKFGGVKPTIATKISEEEAAKIPEYNPSSPERSIYRFSLIANTEKLYNSTYGRDSLGKLSNGENLQGAYDDMMAYLKKVHDGDINIDSTYSGDSYCLQRINISKYRLSEDEVFKVFMCVKCDNPEFFWLDGNHFKTSANPLDPNKILTIIPEVYGQFKTKDLRASMKTQINKAIDDILSNVPAGDAYETELALQKKVVDGSVYDPNWDNSNASANDHNIVGILVDHVGVCESYAKTMQLLLNAEGIDNIYIVGWGGTRADGGGHAWNEVKINGDYRNLDVTWDDLGGNEFDGIEYDFFNSKNDYFKLLHEKNTPDASTGTKEYLYDTPDCNNDDESYYSKNPDMLLKDSQNLSNDDVKRFLSDKINASLQNNNYEVRLAGETSGLASKMKEVFATDADRNGKLDILEESQVYNSKCSDFHISDDLNELNSGERELRIKFTPKDSGTLVNKITLPNKITFDTNGIDNKSYYLSPNMVPSNATNKSNLRWGGSGVKVVNSNGTLVSGDANGVVSIDENGVVKPIKAGTAIITATVDGVTSNSCEVEVKQLQETTPVGETKVTSVSVTPSTITLYGVGAIQQLTATCYPEDATNKNISWISKNEGIATADAGLLKAKALGSTVIYCIPDEPAANSAQAHVIVNVVNASKTQLQELYNAHKEDSKGNHTDDSWNSFLAALTGAKGVIDNQGATDQQVNDSYNALNKAISDLKENSNIPSGNVDKTALQSDFDAHKNEDQEKYTADSWNAFKTALDEAKVILDKADSTQDEVSAAKTKLDTAVNGLIVKSGIANKADLEALYNNYKNDTQGDYTDASWTSLKAALNNANTILGKVDATQGEVDSAKSALQTAIDGLRKEQTVDKSTLLTLYNANKDKIQGNYTLRSWSAFKTAINTAAKVLADKNVGQGDVDGAKQDLKTAIRNLTETEVVNKGTLQSLYDRHKNDVQGSYTDSSWIGFKSALNAAGAVLGRTDAAQSDVDAATNNLQLAINRLDVNSKVKVTGIAVNGSDSITVNGGTTTLAADVIPTNAANKSVTWSSSNDSIASVDGSGIVTAKENGVVVIKATANDGSGVFGIKTINVSGQSGSAQISDSMLKSVSISGTEEVGHTLKAKVKYDGVKPDLQYKWLRAEKRDGDYSDISGATDSEYRLKGSDKNKYIKVIVTATINKQTYSVEDTTGKIDRDASDDNDNDTSTTTSSTSTSSSSSISSTTTSSSRTSLSYSYSSSTKTTISSSSYNSTIISGNGAFTNPSGHPVTGWTNSKNGWYFLDSRGYAKVGWILDNGNWYYLIPDAGDNYGVMKTGWINYNGNWYYLNSSGSMVTNTTIDGYRIGADGAML